MYRTRIQNFQKLENDLITQNTELRRQITDGERSCHDTVSANIRRFDQFKVKKKGKFSKEKNISFCVFI